MLTKNRPKDWNFESGRKRANHGTKFWLFDIMGVSKAQEENCSAVFIVHTYHSRCHCFCARTASSLMHFLRMPAVKTHPLHVAVFSAFRKELNAAIASTMLTGVHIHVDMYHYCCVLATAYHRSFTHQNIISSFGRASLWLIDPMRLSKTPKPRDANQLQDVIVSTQMIEMLERERVDMPRTILARSIGVPQWFR